jgi:polyketide-type polyunsaturated fatty acid synthase PfaA
VGAGALFPQSDGAGGFWRNILDGTDLIDDVPEGRWRVDDYFDDTPGTKDKTYARRGGFLSPTPFDPVRYGIPPNIIEATDTSQLLALIVAQQVLDDATGGQFSEMDRDRTSVVLGVTSGQELMNEMASRLQRPIWQKVLREMGFGEDEVQQACDRIADHYVDWQESTFPGLLGNVVAGRIANRFDLGGTNCVTDAACASTLSALTLGLNELYMGHSDLVIAGGVDTFNDIFMFMCFSQTPALSKSGDCRPFSEAADGTMLGEGLAMFALKRLEDAERDGDEIYAVLTGIGSSSDGRSKSIYAPLAEGQAKALRRAYDRAGYGPETVGLVEAHGTGTNAGDAAEFEGLRQVFDAADREERQWCALGSVKSQVGHTKAAAGAAGLFKVVMALHHRVLPPTIKIDSPNPKLSLESSPFYLNTYARPWIHGAETPRRAAVSAFGFGGSNFHATAEEYLGEQRKPRFRHTDSELIVLSADTPDALVARCEELAEELDDAPGLDTVAHDTQLDFVTDDVRLSIVAESLDDLRRKLTQAADSIRSRPDDSFTLPNGIFYGRGERTGDTAFVFPGQGSQYLEMGAELAREFDEARQVWDRASATPLDGTTTLDRVVFPPPVFDDESKTEQSRRLRQTQWAQPALGAASLASLEILRATGLEPDAVAGHSFGEVTALAAAGVLSQDDALRVARRRGELMAEAAESTEGGMCAVQSDSETVQALLDEWDLDVVIANYNGPRQVVLSGSVEAIEEAESRLEDEGLGAKRLRVATAFHSSIVADSRDPFAEFLADVDFGDANCAVYANSTAAKYPGDASESREILADQIASAVRFEEMIQAMIDAGVKRFVEVGPGTVLTRLVRRVGGDDAIALSTDAKGRDGLTALWHCLGQLAALGEELRFDAIWKDRWVTPEPAEDPKLAIDIWGGNYNRPYPPADGEVPGPNPPQSRPTTAAKADESDATPPKNPTTSNAHETTPRPAQRNESRTPMSNDQPYQQPHYQQAQHQQAPQTSQQPAAAPDTAWVQAFQESQRQMAQAHAAYQQAMADTHTAFLQAVSTSQSNLTAMLTGEQTSAPAPMQFRTPPPRQYAAPAQRPPAPWNQQYQQASYPQPPAPQPQPQQPPAPQRPPAPQTPPPARTQRPAPPAPTPQPQAAPPQPQAPAPTPETPAPAQPGGAIDLEQLLLDVVADKTGYPAEMLEPDMKLEADLGIDSIKRVEILSAVNEEAPELPEVDGTEMAELSTLREIIDFLSDLNPSAAALQPATPEPAAQPATPEPAPDPAPTNGSTGGGLEEVLLAAVADKTGYPSEMLDLDMKLEADLGIDSIKRVEILSAVNDAMPELPEVDGAEMAELATLREILDFMSSEAPAGGQKKNVRASG